MELSPDEANLLASNEWFAGLPTAVANTLVQAGMRRRLKDGELLHARGDPAQGLYVLLQGFIRICGASEQGREATLIFIEPGTWFGEIALIDKQPRTHDAWAVGSCTALIVPSATIQLLLQNDPQASLCFAGLIARKLRAAMLWIEDMNLLPLNSRLAQKILDLHSRGALVENGELMVSQDDLATLIGASRQSINRELKLWAKQNVVSLSYGKLRILDVHALRTLVLAAK